MAKSVRASTALTVDTRSFGGLVKALGKAQPDIPIHLRVQMREAGQVVADEAKRRAYSEKIAETIRVLASGVNVQVAAGRAKVPEAALLELGNTGSRKSSRAGSSPSSFRHPVFGHKDRWVDQPTHPFLQPALESKVVEVELLITHVLDEAVKTLVFDFEL
jgi:hypothetical protein